MRQTLSPFLATVRDTAQRVGPSVAVAILAVSIVVAQGGHDDLPAIVVAPPQDNAQMHDPVTGLVRRLEAGAVTLEFEPGFGYLRSLLRELRVPVSSQVLVFSKTSLQHQVITPRNPRAIYFNDDVYLGFVPDGRLMEISAVDPQLGAVFYSERQAPGSRPLLVKNHDCFQCHATNVTLGIPGHIVRSVFTRPDGQIAPRTRTHLTDHRSPIEHRWGGWFVSGTLSGDTHMGNALFREGDDPDTFDRAPGTGIKDISRLFYSDRYLTAQSDIVALMVLDHQVHMHNLIAQLRHFAVAGRPWQDKLEELLRYTLFVDEAPLKGPVAGTTTFASDFARRGPADAKGRTLREFDLRKRLLRYPCSYLIYSDAFLGLPTDVKQRFYSRLGDVLAGRDASPAFAILTPEDRSAIREILMATHQEFGAPGR